MLYIAGDLSQRLVELADVLDERLDAAERDLTGRHLQAADDRDGDIAEVADEHGRGRRSRPEKNCAPKLAW